VKPFKLYRKPLRVPARYVDDYLRDERENMRQAFFTSAVKYRRHIRIVTVAASIMFGSIALLLLLEKEVVISVMFICWLVAVGAGVTIPPLVWPGCDNLLEGIGRYCPECGGTPLKRGTRFFEPPECTVCGKILSSGKCRRYSIRACTHCGLVLDDAGL
jgi:hypothetical protein